MNWNMSILDNSKTIQAAELNKITPLTGIQLILATLALGLGSFMNILDISIANVSLPSIAGETQ